MASISSAPNLFPGAPTGATGAGAQGAPNTAAANESTGTFLQLVNGMVQGNTAPGQLPSNLVQFLLTGDASALEGLELGADADVDADTGDADEEDVEGSGELALAAILAGMQPLKPPAPPAAGAGSGQSGAAAAIETSGGRDALQTMLATSQDALSSALDEATTEGPAVDTASAPAQPQQANSAAPLHHLLAAHKAAESAPQAASAEVRTPVGAPGWADEIGTHLTMMAANGREAASLRLSPEHLGPVEVRISMKDGDANVMFTAANADTRSALEQSLPRLREMFASQGLMLGDANVSRDGPRDSFRPATFANTSRGSSDADSVADVKSVTLSRVGLVDTYV